MTTVATMVWKWNHTRQQMGWKLASQDQKVDGMYMGQTSDEVYAGLAEWNARRTTAGLSSIVLTNAR